MKRLLLWFADHFVGTCITLLVLSSAGAYAVTSYDVANEVTMFLDQSISQAQTTGIALAAPQLNGSTFTFSTTSGAILRIRSGNFREDIYATATVNPTTRKVTLANVIRNVCPQVFRGIVSCGNGRNWGKGAIVELIQDARLFNLKANVDRANTFTASGGIRFSGSGSLGWPTFATTAARDQQLGAAPPANPTRAACVTGTGLCYLGIGGAWVTIGNTGTANADTGVAGKVEIPTLSFMQNLTATGSSGAQNVVPLKWLVKNGTGAVSAGRVPTLGSNGALHVSLGGTGLATLTQSGVLVGNGTNAVSLISSSASGAYLRTNSHGAWFAWSPSEETIFTAFPYEKITVAAGDTNFTTNATIPANLATGSVITVQATGTGGSAGAFFRYGLKIGSTEVCLSNQDSTSPDSWKIDAEIRVRRAGATGELSTTCTINGGNTITGSGSKITANTTTTNAVNVFDRSNGTTGYLYLTSLQMKKRN